MLKGKIFGCNCVKCKCIVIKIGWKLMLILINWYLNNFRLFNFGKKWRKILKKFLIELIIKKGKLVYIKKGCN